jgi:hypothetical protein
MKLRTLAGLASLVALLAAARAPAMLLDGPGHTITVPGDITAEATGPGGAVVTYTASVDPADEPVTCGPASGSLFAITTTTVTCTADDADPKSFDVTVQDTTAPTVTVPANITDSSTDPGGKTITYGPASASDSVDGPLTPTCSPASGSNFPIGTTTVTCSATDSHGNTGSASFTVTVTFSDTTAPTFTSVPSPMTVEATSSAGAVVGYTVTASDNSGTPPTVACSPGSGSAFPITTTTVNCTATDGSRNHADTSFTVTVHDTTAPNLNLPSNITVEADSAGGKVVSYSASATDLVSGGLAASCSPASGSTFPIGTTAVNCSATDGSGNTAHGSFTVTVKDSIGPTFTAVPANRQVEANGPSGSIVNYTVPTANDAVDGPQLVSCNPPSGSTFPLGMTTVTCSASDSHGSTSTASFTIRVADTTPPSLTVPADRSVYADTPDGISIQSHYVAAFLSEAQAVDAVDPHPLVGNNAPEFLTVGAHFVSFSARDASGNSVTKGATLDVRPMPPAGTPPLATPPARTPPKDVTGLKAEPGDSRVRLSWQVPDGVDHVVVTHQLTDGGDPQVVYTGSGKSYTDRNLVNGLEYRFVVTSVDKSGNTSAGVAVAALPKATLLRSPRDGAKLKGPPKLVWVRNSEATYYNVQLFRGTVKILSTWPSKATLTLSRSWKYQGHRYKLMRGIYRWYVWPGFGARENVDYGEMLGFSSFQIVR